MSDRFPAVIAALRGTPTVPPTAKEHLPRAAGFYAWWQRPRALDMVPSTPHPSEPWELLYVGIAPGRRGSKQLIRSRVVGNHLGGNTGSSTFRLSLAALLLEQERFSPQQRSRKVVLPREENRRLTAWQHEHLALTWYELEEPWSAEGEVIAEMSPPLNLAENAGHPFHATMSEARRRFRAAALP